MSKDFEDSIQELFDDVEAEAAETAGTDPERSEALDELRARIERFEKKEKKNTIFLGAGLLVLLALVAAAMTLTVIRLNEQKAMKEKYEALFNTARAEPEKDLEDIKKKMDNLQNYINAYYLFDEDFEAVGDHIYKAMFEALGDPYSVYYNAEEYERMNSVSSATYKGLGITVSKDEETSCIMVVDVMAGSGAEDAGILVGDLITEMEHISVSGETLSETVERMREGEVGSKANVTVYRPSTGETFEVDIERRIVDQVTVDGVILEDGVGYVWVKQFGSATEEQFKSVISELTEEGMTSMIVDLRNNPGGNLTTVTKMLDYLLPEGIIMYTEDKKGNRTDYTSDAGCNDIPMAVLVNGSSASASEVFAGAVKDHKRGTIVGTTTYGKGIVQVLHALGDGSAVKVTVSRYYTPNGICIHGTGIEPDVEVEFEEPADPEAGWRSDNQVVKAFELLQTGN